MTTSIDASVSNFLIGYVSGGISAIAYRTIIFAPKAFVMIRLTNMSAMLRDGKLKTAYTGVFDCLYRVAREEGIREIFRGNGRALLSFTPHQSLLFALNDYFKEILGCNKRASLSINLLGNYLFAGGLAGFVTTTAFYPLDKAKEILQQDARDTRNGKARRFTNLWDVYKKAWKEGEIFELYRGFGLVCLSRTVKRSLYLGLYDTLNTSGEGYLAVKLLIGWVAARVADYASIPIELVRHRMIFPFKGE